MAARPFAAHSAGRPIIGLARKVAGDELEQIGNAIAVAVFVGDGLDPAGMIEGLPAFQLGAHGLESLAERVVRPGLERLGTFLGGHVAGPAIVQLPPGADPGSRPALSCAAVAQRRQPACERQCDRKGHGAKVSMCHEEKSTSCKTKLRPFAALRNG